MSGLPNLFGRVRANHLSSIVLVYAICFHVLHTPAQGLAYPRFSSKSFRFPGDHNDELEGPLKAFLENMNILSGKHSQVFVPYGEARKSAIPISPSSQSSSSSSSSSAHHEIDSYEEGSSSAEIVEPADDSILNDASSVGHNTTRLEEEELRKLLCPSTIPFKNNLPDKNRTIPVLDNISRESSSGFPVDFPSPFRYDLQAGKCAQVGGKEHCGENMIFVADMDSGAYGYCECDFEDKIHTRTDALPAGLTRPMVKSTPLVYHPVTKSCHRLYDQAYCKKTEWLVLNREVKGPACEPRKCPSSLSFPQTPLTSSSDNKPFINNNRRRSSKLLTPSLWTDAFTTEVSLPIIRSSAGINLWVPLNGTGPCVQLNRENTEYCEEGEKVVFNVGDIAPKCGIPGREIEGRAIIRNACPPGSFYSIIGRCQPDWDF